MEVDVIAAFNHKGRFIVISIDKNSKWWVENNGTVTQQELDNKEIVRYLAHAANDKI